MLVSLFRSQSLRLDSMRLESSEESKEPWRKLSQATVIIQGIADWLVVLWVSFASWISTKRCLFSY